MPLQTRVCLVSQRFCRPAFRNLSLSVFLHFFVSNIPGVFKQEGKFEQKRKMWETQSASILGTWNEWRGRMVKTPGGCAFESQSRQWLYPLSQLDFPRKSTRTSYGKYQLGQSTTKLNETKILNRQWENLANLFETPTGNRPTFESCENYRQTLRKNK